MTEEPAQARIAELEADNRRLRDLLDSRDAPGELRHRVRNTVAILRTIVRKSAQKKRDSEDYVAHLEDRLDAIARAQAAADESGVVELHRLLADELLHYGASEGGRVTLSGPDVELQPRAGQVFALAVHELAVNAVEHGAFGAGSGTIAINWNVTSQNGEPQLIFTWEERGDTDGVADAPVAGFGTEVLTQTLRYELKAETDLTFDSGGLVCTIRFPLPDWIGRPAQGKTNWPET